MANLLAAMGSHLSKMPHDERGDGVRVMVPQRNQIELRSFDLDATISSDHRARVIWEFVAKLDLSRFYEAIQARGSVGGSGDAPDAVAVCDD